MEMVPLARKEKAEIERALVIDGTSNLAMRHEHFTPQQEHTQQNDESNLDALPGLMIPAPWAPKGRRLALQRVVQPASLHFIVSISARGMSMHCPMITQPSLL